MTLATFSLITFAIGAVVAGAYWYRVARRQAQHARKVFAPRPQSPAPADYDTLLRLYRERDGGKSLDDEDSDLSWLLKRQAS
jgi:hypothetical protein